MRIHPHEFRISIFNEISLKARNFSLVSYLAIKYSRKMFVNPFNPMCRFHSFTSYLVFFLNTDPDNIWQDFNFRVPTVLLNFLRRRQMCCTQSNVLHVVDIRVPVIGNVNNSASSSNKRIRESRSIPLENVTYAQSTPESDRSVR